MSRPEYQSTPEAFYDLDEAKKYTQNSRIIEIQAIMAERCIQLCNLADHPCLVLDVGCGSGLSGEMLSEYDHIWVGVDISENMLNCAMEKGTDGDVYLNDIGQGFRFRPGIFDGAISVSVLQWIFVAAKKDHNPFKRLQTFFQCLYTCLAAGARAIFQFYPDGPQQLEMCISTAVKAGFKAAVVVDYPDSKKRKKIYLVLCAGDGDLSNIKPLTNSTEEGEEEFGEEEEKDDQRVSMLSKRSKGIQKMNHSKDKKPSFKSKEWIKNKKERQRRQGKEVKGDTKYSGRRRRINFN